MRRLPILAVFAFSFLLVASCVDRDPVSPDQSAMSPNFSMQMSECWPDDVEGQIEALFPEGGTRNAALKKYRNILRDVEKGRLDNAVKKAASFETFVRNQSDKLNDPCGEAAPTQDQAETVLIGNVYAVAGGGDPLVIPPEAYEPTGGIGLIDPVTGGTVVTNNLEAAVVADEDAFDGTGLVTIVLVRLLDPDVELPPASGPIPGFQAYPEGYDITSSRQLTPEAEGGSGAIVELCVVTDGLDPQIEARLVIGHDLGGGLAELLYPRLGTNEVSCGAAGPYPPIIVAEESPAWLDLASRAIQPALGLLKPQPLHASLLAGKGLGGRTKSFSNFAPVDPWSLSVSPESATIDLDENTTVQLTPTLTVPSNETDPPNPFPTNADYTWTSSDDGIAFVNSTGLVEAESEGVATIEVSYEGLTATSEITVDDGLFTLTVIVVGDGFVDEGSESGDIFCPEDCTADYGSGTPVGLFIYGDLIEIDGDCEDVGGDPDCTVIMDEDQEITFTFEEYESLF